MCWCLSRTRTEQPICPSARPPLPTHLCDPNPTLWTMILSSPSLAFLAPSFLTSPQMLPPRTAVTHSVVFVNLEYRNPTPRSPLLVLLTTTTALFFNGRRRALTVLLLGLLRPRERSNDYGYPTAVSVSMVQRLPSLRLRLSSIGLRCRPPSRCHTFCRHHRSPRCQPRSSTLRSTTANPRSHRPSRRHTLWSR